MGGKVLDLPEIRIYHQGKAEGKAEEQVNTERERKRADEATRRAEAAEEENRILKEKLAAKA